MDYNRISVRVHSWRLSLGICRLPFCLALLALGACSDWRDGIPDTYPSEGRQAEEISFAASVVSSAVTTRADGSLVNLNEYSLPVTKERSYWRAGTDGQVAELKKAYRVGIFGCYTGQNKWEDLVKSATMSTTEISELSEDAKNARLKMLNDYYSPNFLYNDSASIVNSAGELRYDSLRFWPNNRLSATPTQHEYCTFWAYYPYNPTASPGIYGISITNSDIGEGKGMGSVKFTMHPDAAQQNDFMISDLVTDCNRDAYPLQQGPLGSYAPKPVQFRFHHMLAQVRLYAFIRGTDKLVYKDDLYYAEGATYTDAWGKGHTVTAEEAGKIPVIDEENSVRWLRTEYLDIRGEKKRADISYKMEFNNIKTSATFYPEYNDDGTTSIGYTDATTLGSATVNHFIMNPYWFRFDETDQHRYMLNDNYMYGYFEDTPVYLRQDATSAKGGLDGIDWSAEKWDDLYDLESEEKNTPLHYLDLTEGETRRKELQDPGTPIDPEDLGKGYKHYNYPPGNILMVVPQVLTDEQVPHIVLTATGRRAKWNSESNKWEGQETVTAKVTINLLQMNLRWESGFIYSYAFIDELRPGDDIVRGPESITTIFDTTQYTDQW